MFSVVLFSPAVWFAMFVLSLSVTTTSPSVLLLGTEEHFSNLVVGGGGRGLTSDFLKRGGGN